MNASFPFQRSDASVVRQVLQGDARAFEVLVSRYQKKAYAVAYAHGAGFHEAEGVEDVVQQSFLRAFRALPDLRDPERFGPWFLRIVQNTARNHVERRRSMASFDAETGEASSWLDRQPAPDSEEPLEGKELRERLWQRVAELPEATREAVFLYYQDGRSVRAVAKALGITPAAVKQRLKRGRDLLRDALRRDLGETLRDMLPSARELRQRARSLSLLVLAALPASWISSTAGAASPAASLSSSSILSQTLSGALVMSSKKIALSALFAVLIGLGGLLVLNRLSGHNRAGVDVEARAGGFRAPDASSAQGSGARPEVEPPGGAKGLTSDSSKVASLPASIEGRVTDGERGIVGARIHTISLTAWLEVARIDKGELDLEKKLARLSAAYRKEAARAPEVTTGPGGAFTVRGLAPGDYRLLASHPAHLPHWATLASVPAQGSVKTEIQLLPAVGIRGKVVDETGRPVPGAVVEAEPMDLVALKGRARQQKRLLDWEEGRALIDEARAETDAGGVFRLGSLSTEPYALRASHRDFLTGDSVSVPAGEEDAVLTLRRGVSVRGRIVDPEERPVGGAEVKLTPARLTEVHRIFDWTGSDAEPVGSKARDGRARGDGRFHIEGLEARAYDLAVTAPGLAPLLREVDVTPGGLDLGDVELVAPLEIAGVVVGPDGKPFDGARVWASRPGTSVRASNTLGLSLPPSLAETVSGEQGRFVLSGLPGGSFAVAAEARDCADAVERDVAAGTMDLKLALGRGLTIHGRVIDAESLEPLSGVEVKVGFSRTRAVTSDADGAFVLRGFPMEEVHGGTTFVRASHSQLGSHFEHNVMVLGCTERSPVEIRFGASAQAIRGMVVDEAGNPVAGAQVWVESTDAEASGFTASAEQRSLSARDGTFSLLEPDWLRHTVDGFRIGVVALHPLHAAGRTGPLGTPATGEPWPAVELVLTAGTALEGKVTGPGGLPLSGARITVWRADSESGRAGRGIGALLSSRTAFSSRDGAYRLGGLEAGVVEVTVEALDHARTSAGGLVLGSELVRQDFQLARGASIEGRVADTSGAPIPGAEVTAVLESELLKPSEDMPEFTRRMEERSRTGLAIAWTRHDGSFKLVGLPGGPFTVLARASGFDAAKAGGVREGETALELVLSRFSALRGSVREKESGNAITAFTVNAIDKARRSAEADAGDWRVGSQGELWFSDPLGRFLYDGLRPGEYEVIVQARGFLAASFDVRFEAGEELPLEAILSRGARIEGFALDAETGLPVPGAFVSCYRQRPREEHEAEMTRQGFVRAVMAPPSGMANTTAGADGRFVLDGLIPGEYSLTATHPFYTSLGSPGGLVKLSAGETSVRDLTLQAAGRIVGTIRGLRKDAPRGHRVHYGLHLERLGEADGSREAQLAIGPSGAYVDPTGRLSADSVPPGSYRLSLTRNESKPGKFIELAPGAGTQALEPVGKPKTTVLGEVEVRPREITRFHGKVEAE